MTPTELDQQALYYAADKLAAKSDNTFHAQHIKQAYIDGFKQIMQFEITDWKDISFGEMFERFLVGETIVVPAPTTEFLEKQFNEMQQNDKRLIEKIKNTYHHAVRKPTD